MALDVVTFRARYWAPCFVLFLIVMGVYYNFPWINRETFIWQYTTLAEVFRLVHRDSCVIPVSSIPLNETRKLRIGMVMMYGKKPSKKKVAVAVEDTWSEELMIPILKNRQEYCDYHNYTMINAKDVVDPSRPVSWSKLLAMDKHFQTNQYDYLFYIDMDIVIMNFSIPLERFIEGDGYQHDIIITKDWNGINFGVWMAKSSNWTLWFLRTAWNQTQLIPARSAEGIPHPFSYEQRAVHYLLDTPAWRNSKLQRYSGNSSAIRRHFSVLPQCAFNSYTVHPLDLRGNRDLAQYKEGDFIVHFAGKKGYKKLKLMDYYLQRVDKTRR